MIIIYLRQPMIFIGQLLCFTCIQQIIIIVSDFSKGKVNWKLIIELHCTYKMIKLQINLVVDWQEEKIKYTTYHHLFYGP